MQFSPEGPHGRRGECHGKLRVEECETGTRSMSISMECGFRIFDEVLPKVDGESAVVGSVVIL